MTMRINSKEIVIGVVDALPVVVRVLNERGYTSIIEIVDNRSIKVCTRFMKDVDIEKIKDEFSNNLGSEYTVKTDYDTQCLIVGFIGNDLNGGL